MVPETVSGPKLSRSQPPELNRFVQPIFVTVLTLGKRALLLRVFMAALSSATKIRFLQIPEHNTSDIRTLRVQ